MRVILDLHTLCLSSRSSGSDCLREVIAKAADVCALCIPPVPSPSSPHCSVADCCSLSVYQKNPNLINNVLLEPESNSFPGEQSLGAGKRLPVNHPTLQISVGVNRHSKAWNQNVPGSFLW